MAKRTAIETGGALPLAGRTSGKFVLDVARITGGAVTVIIETSPTGEDDGLWTQLVSFGAINAVGTTQKASIADWTLAAREKFVRARISTLTASEVAFSVRADLPFVDASADSALFSKELRSFADGFARIVGEAEDAVLRELMPRTNPTDVVGSPFPSVVALSSSASELLGGLPDELVIDADMRLVGFGDEVRRAIVQQAEHLFRRHKLANSAEASALVSLRQMPLLAPGLMSGLERFRNQKSITWRGR